MFALLVLGCAVGTDDDSTEPEPVALVVGSLEDSVEGSSGVELPVQVWFPAAEASEDSYLYGGLVSGIALEDAVPYGTAPHPVVLFFLRYAAGDSAAYNDLPMGNAALTWESAD